MSAMANAQIFLFAALEQRQKGMVVWGRGEWEKEHMHCGKIIPGVRLERGRRRAKEIEQNTKRR